MSAPLVSVVIAAWNAGHFLPATLQTVLNQTWERLEIIVVDDGSTDETASLIVPFLHRIQYKRRPHQGLAAARNAGIGLARGEYIALLDADDLWLPEKVETQVAVALRHREAGLIVCDGEEFSETETLRHQLFPQFLAEEVRRSATGEVVRDIQHEFIERNLVSCPSQVLIPRQVINEVGLFIDSGAQDYDYYLRVSLLHPVVFHGQALTRWRYHPGSMSGPAVTRMVRWGLGALPVLIAHRARCRPEHAALLEERIQQLTRSICYELMVHGRRTGRLDASANLLRVLRWVPSAPPLVHLAGLWAPGPIYRLGAGAARRVRLTFG